MWEERARSGGEGRGVTDKQRVGVQVLLLRVPGAELGWAGLSDTPPSAGGKEKGHSEIHLTEQVTAVLGFGLMV